MGFLKKLFGEKRENFVDFLPTRGMNLKFVPEPANGEKLAEQFVSVIKKNENIDLNYSVSSLDFVDQFLQNFKNDGVSVNDFAETIFVAGCYVGQVMVLNNSGVWIKQEDADLPEGITMMPIVVKLPNNKVCDPIVKAFKRFSNGEVDSVKYFHHVFTSDS